MRIGILIAIGWLFLGAAAMAQENLPRDPAIENTIQGQVDAFMVDDFDQAFTFASPTIKSIFGDSERFGSMVRNGYPMVWRPSELRFLELREIGGSLWQKVLVRDRSGAIHLLDYQMVETSEGWRINGVQLLRKPDVGA